jgi:hypothetical protein
MLLLLLRKLEPLACFLPSNERTNIPRIICRENSLGLLQDFVHVGRQKARPCGEFGAVGQSFAASSRNLNAVVDFLRLFGTFQCPHGDHRDGFVTPVGGRLPQQNGTFNHGQDRVIVTAVHVLDDLKASLDFVHDDIGREDGKEHEDTNDPNEARNGPEIVCAREEGDDERGDGQTDKEKEVHPVDGGLIELWQGKAPGQGVSP